MAEDNTSESAVLLLGNLGRKSLAFCILANLDLETEVVQARASAGAPELSYFNPISAEAAFNDNQNELVDIKRRINREKRDFYNEDAEDVFEKLFADDVSEICTMLKTDDMSTLQKYFQEKLRSHFAQPDVRVQKVPTGSSQSNRSDESESPSDQSESSGEETAIVEVSPLIDAINGTKIENLNQGESIYVQLSDKYSNLYGSEGKDGEPPILESTFLDFDPRSSDDEEGLIQVQIQDGVKGRGDVPRGTLIKTADYEQKTQSSNEAYEQSLLTLILITASLLIAVIVLMVIFLDFGGL